MFHRRKIYRSLHFLLCITADKQSDTPIAEFPHFSDRPFKQLSSLGYRDFFFGNCSHSQTLKQMALFGPDAGFFIFSIALFMVLPYLIASLLHRVGATETIVTIAEAVVRILLFLFYMVLISKMEDIQRVFMYHGAEHKCINCVEHGLPLTVENVMKSSRFHKRCGTSFLFFVIIVSIIFFIGFFAVVPVKAMWLRIVIRILLVPAIAGISYEFIRLAGSSDNSAVAFLSKPGLALQKLTTKEPTPDMTEVAIAAVEAVFDWKDYLRKNFPETEIPEEP